MKAVYQGCGWSGEGGFPGAAPGAYLGRFAYGPVPVVRPPERRGLRLDGAYGRTPRSPAWRLGLVCCAIEIALTRA